MTMLLLNDTEINLSLVVISYTPLRPGSSTKHYFSPRNRISFSSLSFSLVTKLRPFKRFVFILCFFFSSTPIFYRVLNYAKGLFFFPIPFSQLFYLTNFDIFKGSCSFYTFSLCQFRFSVNHTSFKPLEDPQINPLTINVYTWNAQFAQIYQ